MAIMQAYTPTPQVSSGEELEEMINSVILNVSGCTLAMYGIHASPNPSEIEALCNTCGAECSRTFTVSAIEKTVGRFSTSVVNRVQCVNVYRRCVYCNFQGSGGCLVGA